MLGVLGERRKGSEIISLAEETAAVTSRALRFLKCLSGTPANALDASDMLMPNSRWQKGPQRRRLATWALMAAIGFALAGCSDITQVYRRGYIVPEGALEQVPLGASQEQVLIVLGTPSTVATVSGEAFYYISQRAEQPLAFMNQSVTNQRVVAVYFDRDRRVERIADYGMKDGKVFDFVSRTTPTGGAEMSYVTYILAVAKPF